MSVGARSATLWVLILGFLIHVLCNAYTTWDTGAVAAFLTVFFLMAISIIHGLSRYTGRQMLAYFAIAFLVSNIYENLSILTGFPFGRYHYSDALGPKIFYVPVLIAPAYIGAGYLAWTLGHVLLGVYERALRGREIVTVPLIASFVMVMWDLAMDPKAATINKGWIWHGGGNYFGVPFVNYLGWLLCVYTIFLLFALIIARNEADMRESELPKGYWHQAVGAYAVLGFLQITGALTQPNKTVTDPSGQAWQTDHIYTSMALIALFTMGFVSLLSVLLIAQRVRNGGQAA